MTQSYSSLGSGHGPERIPGDDVTPLSGLAEELLFRRQRGRSTLIVFTSARARAGVTYVTARAAGEIARQRGLDSLVITMDEASRLPEQPEESAQDTFVESEPHVWMPSQQALESAPIGAEAVEQRIRELRNWPGAFVLLDCPPLGSGIPEPFLSMADGVVVVVAAGETSKRDLAGAAETLNAAGAPVVGMILNKRTYAIPKAIFRHV
jgi:Mrp family chromosome partitioning ATPase